jgi:hypothetical protein
MSQKEHGKSGKIWKHFRFVWVSKDNPNGTPSITEPVASQLANYIKCRQHLNCNHKPIATHVKEGYRHIKNCLTLNNEQKADVIKSCGDEASTYAEFWNINHVKLPSQKRAHAGNDDDVVEFVEANSGKSTSSATPLYPMFNTVTKSSSQIDGDVVDMWTKLEDNQTEFELDFATMLISCNLAINLADNESMREFLQKYCKLKVPSVSILNKRVILKITGASRSELVVLHQEQDFEYTLGSS